MRGSLPPVNALWIWGGGNYGYAEKHIRTPVELYGWGWFNMGLGAAITASEDSNEGAAIHRARGSR